MTRLIAEFPPTFTVWHMCDPATRTTGANDGTGSWSSLLPEPSNAVIIGLTLDVGVGAGDEVTVDVGEEVRAGVGEEVSEGVGDGVMVGDGTEVTVGVGDEVIVGVGEAVGEVVSGGTTTVTYPERPRLLATLKFRTDRFTGYVPGVS